MSETNKIANLKYKKGHNSGKNCRKIVIIELTLDIHKIHLHTAGEREREREREREGLKKHTMHITFHY